MNEQDTRRLAIAEAIGALRRADDEAALAMLAELARRSRQSIRESILDLAEADTEMLRSVTEYGRGGNLLSLLTDPGRPDSLAEDVTGDEAVGYPIGPEFADFEFDAEFDADLEAEFEADLGSGRLDCGPAELAGIDTGAEGGMDDGVGIDAVEPERRTAIRVLLAYLADRPEDALAQLDVAADGPDPTSVGQVFVHGLSRTMKLLDACASTGRPVPQWLRPVLTG
jgi:hypothetical protein